MARSGKALVEFARWAAYRRSPEWMLDMLRWLPMDAAIKWELYNQIEMPDPPPELREQRRWLARLLLRDEPEVREEVVQEGREEAQRKEARRLLRRVLALRNLAPTPEQDARIDACADLSTLHRWHDQAVTAASADEALT